MYYDNRKFGIDAAVKLLWLISSSTCFDGMSMFNRVSKYSLVVHAVQATIRERYHHTAKRVTNVLFDESLAAWYSIGRETD